MKSIIKLTERQKKLFGERHLEVNIGLIIANALNNHPESKITYLLTKKIYKFILENFKIKKKYNDRKTINKKYL